VGEVVARFDRAEFCRRHGLSSQQPLVSLLPGSRSKELQRILPPLLEAAGLVSRRQANVQFVLVVAPSRSLHEAELIVSNSRVSEDLKRSLRVVHGETREALAASDAAAIASGTATLEAALLNTPMVVVYRESATNWHTLGRLISVEHYGLVNLIAGKLVATELIQSEFTAQRVADELMRLIEPQRNSAVRTLLKDVVERLGDGGASKRAAQLITAAVDHR
jgi:lipid-A-disaccharide synthase